MRRRTWAALAAGVGLLLATSADAQITSSTVNSTGGVTQTTAGGFGGGTGGVGGGTFGVGGGSGQGGQTGSGLGSSSIIEGGLLGQSSLAGNTTATNAGSIGGSSLLGKNYAYPMAKGLPTQNLIGGTTTSSVAFGQPLYTVSTGTGTGVGGARGTGLTGGRTGGATGTGQFGALNTGTGGFGQQGGFGTTQSGQGQLGSSAGIDRVVPYVTELGFQPNLAPRTVVGQQVNTMFAASQNRLGAGNSAQLVPAANGNGFVLQGQATSDRERAVMEAMARLSPGVYNVQNNVAVPPARR